MGKHLPSNIYSGHAYLSWSYLSCVPCPSKPMSIAVLVSPSSLWLICSDIQWETVTQSHKDIFGKSVTQLNGNRSPCFGNWSPIFSDIQWESVAQLHKDIFGESVTQLKGNRLPCFGNWSLVFSDIQWNQSHGNIFGESVTQFNGNRLPWLGIGYPVPGIFNRKPVA